LNQHPFDLLVELAPEHIRLDWAALHLARDEHPNLDPARYVRRLDDLAEEIADRRPGLSAPLRYQALRDVLVGRHGFSGNRRDYRDPGNCYLNCVLDRRVGIPVSLSAIWIEIARRLKWPVAGIALPGHFLVRLDDPERFVLADPFEDGQSLTVDDCRRMVAERFDRPVKFLRKLLKPVDTCAILSRLLRNLRETYLEAHNWRRLTVVLQRLVALEPSNGQHLQDLAAVYARQGDMRGAYGCLTVYLRHLPDAHDHDLVRGNLQRLKAALVALN
jgi:regulator of sirC expression with transglutaminase-like and TPR domain